MSDTNRSCVLNAEDDIALDPAKFRVLDLTDWLNMLLDVIRSALELARLHKLGTAVCSMSTLRRQHNLLNRA